MTPVRPIAFFSIMALSLVCSRQGPPAAGAAKAQDSAAIQTQDERAAQLPWLWPVNAEEPLQPFINDTYYIASESVAHFSFNVYRRSKVDLVIAIDNTVPLDVIVFPIKVSETQYSNLLINMGVEMSQQMIARIFGNEARLTPPDKNVMTEDDLFSFALSKKGAYGRYESNWQVLDVGTYTVFLDNQGNFTPTRGDAPVRVAMYALPVN